MNNGKAIELAPGIRRILAPNPGMMTGSGTNTYLIGETSVAVVDPGPNLQKHIDAIECQSPGTIRWILVTHTHPDHSPAASILAKITGAQLLGMSPPPHPSQDHSFIPDRELKDGDVLETDEFVLEAVHTPGHASNHLCYRHQQQGWLFTGDHIMSGSTVVIDPPDGNMNDYIDSLKRVKTLALTHLAPGHGDLLDNPGSVAQWIIDHRLDREEKIIEALAQNPDSTSHNLVPLVYTDVDPALFAWAERSLLAHLIRLEQNGTATRTDDYWSFIES